MNNRLLHCIRNDDNMIVVPRGCNDGMLLFARHREGEAQIRDLSGWTEGKSKPTFNASLRGGTTKQSLLYNNLSSI